MKFSELRLDESILRAVSDEGYETATPIQAQTIPHVLEGRDVLGSAQTGTGKTAAFALPMLHRLVNTSAKAAPGKHGQKRARALILSPTRELTKQIAQSFVAYGKHLPITGTVIFGGVNQNPQVQALKRGVDVIVATPGRLQDLYEQGHVDLSGIETLVLDEADRMLDMGFIHDIRRICDKLPKERQTLFFSATMPKEILNLANSLLQSPVRVEITPEVATVEAIDQSVYFVPREHKTSLLAHLIDSMRVSRAIVFTRTKHGADRVVRQLRKNNIHSEAIHGNKTQNARERALKQFRDGHTQVLVATDIASRGIDVDGVSHVFNYDLTHEPETYVHRIGRTARAGASGVAISFCDRDERGFLRAIQKTIRKELTVRSDAPNFFEQTPEVIDPREQHNAQRPMRQRNGGGGNNSGGGSKFSQRNKPRNAHASGSRNSEGQAARPRRRRRSVVSR